MKLDFLSLAEASFACGQLLGALASCPVPEWPTESCTVVCTLDRGRPLFLRRARECINILGFLGTCGLGHIAFFFVGVLNIPRKM